MVVLLVTWLIAGQPPHSYQTTFSTPAACKAARAQVLADARRIEANDQARFAKEEAEAAARSQGRLTMLSRNYTPPQVSAVCASK